MIPKKYNTRLQSGKIQRVNYAEINNHKEADDNTDRTDPEWTEDFERRKPKSKLTNPEKDILHKVIHGTKFSGNKDKLYACPICTEEFKVWQLEISHDIAKYFNGSWSITNLLLLCHYCNN